MTISALYQGPKATEPQWGDRELLESWAEHRDGFIWVDLCDEESSSDEQILREIFETHPLAIQDALRNRHPPKIEIFDHTLFLIVRGLDAGSQNIEFGVIHLAMFIGDGFLVTRHVGSSVSVNWLKKEIKSGRLDMSLGGGYLAVQLINRLVRRYLEILLALEPRLDELESLVFATADDKLLSELTRYKNRLREIIRIAKYHLDVVHKLQRDPVERYGAIEHELTDVYEQLERTSSLAELYYTMASDLIDGHLAYTSHRLNRVMQILTVITVIFVPLTFIAGIYGMNFEIIPELSVPYGYFVVLGVMATIGIGLLAYFKRKNWV